MVGTRFAHYEITSHLGSGGMGEVYRAADTRLGRSVAIKVLPAAFSHDAERVARLQREARVLAALNHPNIAGIYGFEELDGRHLLVMELAPGDTLEERIRRGPIPLPDALPIARQIAEALEEAHEAGIVHRDLKPANIKLTADGRVKVLDFGLAKAWHLEPSDASLANSPTLTVAATEVGVILGTAAYMSPEQARGKPVDRRADIWAFGVVLFRMLCGGSLFEGETVTDTLAHVLEREPDWTQLPAGTPPALRTLLQRCLTKNPRNRLQSIGDARIVLQELIEQPVQPDAAVRPSSPLWKRALPWAIAPVALAAGFLLNPPEAPQAHPLLQFDYPLPAGHVLVHMYRHGAEVSPDGRRVAFVGITPGGPRQIHVRSLELATDTVIPGTEGAFNLFFSPDGNWLGFQQGLQIKKVALSGGAPPTVVVENLGLEQGPDWGPPGITWGSNGQIVYAATLGAGLSVVRDAGGAPEAFTELDTAAHEASHRLPHFLPDASAVLFTVLPYSAVTPDWSRAQVWVKSLENGERRLLLENALDARYAGNNTLVFARQGTIFAVRFDPSSLRVEGSEVPVLDGVNHSLYGPGAITWTGVAQYSVGADGTLFYAPGDVDPPMLSSLVWLNRQGDRTPVEGMRSMARFGPRVLPDGLRIASSELYINKDIWLFDTARGTEDRVTFEGQNSYPVWAPDGSRLAFRSDRAGPLQIYLSDGVNTRDVKPLTAGPFDVPSSWTPDGKELLFTRGVSSLGGNTDIYAVSIDNPSEPRAIAATPADERFPEVSPDGRWLAYTSNDTGRFELYVQPYQGGPGARITITSGGAQDPAWSKNSNELFYRVGPRLMAVPFTSGGSFVPGKPVRLFERSWVGGGGTVRGTYDVSPDGRFLVTEAIQDATARRNQTIFPSTLRILLNWTQGIQQPLSGQ